jgi:hypothetical protein
MKNKWKSLILIILTIGVLIAAILPTHAQRPDNFYTGIQLTGPYGPTCVCPSPLFIYNCYCSILGKSTR